MAKEKKAVTIQIDGTDYTEDQLNDQQKMCITHINSLQQKISSAEFNLDQLKVGKEAFVNILSQSLANQSEEIAAE